MKVRWNGPVPKAAIEKTIKEMFHLPLNTYLRLYKGGQEVEISCTLKPDTYALKAVVVPVPVPA